MPFNGPKMLEARVLTFLRSLALQSPAARLEAMAWGEPELGNPRRPELGLAKAMAGTGKGI